MVEKDLWMDNQQVQELTGCKRSRAGEIIRQLNEELKTQGYLIPLPGRVPRAYLLKRLGLLTEEE